jgi:hypothetical protein
MSDLSAVLVQIFWPLIRKSSPSSRAEVCRLARSLPAPGSEYPWHHMTSPRMVGPIQRRFCSSVPCSSSVGASIEGPWAIMPRGTPARLNSSSMMTVSSRSGGAPYPPYSRGMVRAQ